MRTVALALLLSIGLGISGAAAKQYCKRSEPCWPTDAEINALAASLNPAASRRLFWANAQAPRVCGVPWQSPGEQPLYGLGLLPLRPLYNESESDRAHECFTDVGAPPEKQQQQQFAPTLAAHASWLDADLRSALMSDQLKLNQSAAQPFAPEFCLVSTRNGPYERWTPAFVVWPLNGVPSIVLTELSR